VRFECHRERPFPAVRKIPFLSEIGARLLPIAQLPLARKVFNPALPVLEPSFFLRLKLPPPTRNFTVCRNPAFSLPPLHTAAFGFLFGEPTYFWFSLPPRRLLSPSVPAHLSISRTTAVLSPSVAPLPSVASSAPVSCHGSLTAFPKETPCGSVRPPPLHPSRSLVAPR